MPSLPGSPHPSPLLPAASPGPAGALADATRAPALVAPHHELQDVEAHTGGARQPEITLPTLARFFFCLFSEGSLYIRDRPWILNLQVCQNGQYFSFHFN